MVVSSTLNSMLVVTFLALAFVTGWLLFLFHSRTGDSEQGLLQGRQVLDRVVANLDDGVFHATADGQLIFVNPALAAMAGAMPDALSGCHWHCLLPETLVAEIRQAFEVSEETLFSYPFVLERTSGTLAQVELRVERLLDATGGVAGLVGVVLDRTGEREQEHLKELASAIFAATSDAIVFFDRNRRVVAINPAFERLVQLPASELLNRRLDYPRPIDPDPTQLLGMVRALQRDGHWQGDMECQLPNQEKRMLSWTVDAIHNTRGKIVEFTAILSDVTHHYLALHEMRTRAHHDALTRILNRAGLEERFQATCGFAERDGKGVAVALLDLDGFKPINDTHGHQVGDQVLQEVARRLSKSLRSYDQVARLGGDEFVVVFFDVKKTDQALQHLGQKLLRALAPPIHLSEQALPIRVGVSIGFSRFPEDGKNLEDLLEVADAAMYQAKRQGKGCCVIAGSCSGTQLA